MATATARGATAAAEYPTRMYIDGQWCDAQDGKTLAVINPADESVLAEVAYGTRAEADRAIAAAARAFPAWRALSVYDRAKVLKKTADLMRERADGIARTLTLEQGKPLAEAKAEVLHSADTFEWFAEEGKRAYGQIIPPTNIGQAALRHQAPGRRRRHDQPVELPDHAAQPQDRPGPGRRLHHRLPPGRADAALPDPDLRVPGRRRRAPGRRQPRHRPGPGDRRRVLREPRRPQDQLHRLDRGRQGADAPLGRPGEAAEPGTRRPRPVHRLPRRRLHEVAQAAVIGKFRNNGQVCIAPSRFYVHEKISKEFTEAAVELARSLKLGNGLEPGVEVGPMFEDKALDKTSALVEDARDQGGQDPHRRQPLEPLRQGLLLRADRPPRGQWAR